MTRLFQSLLILCIVFGGAVEACEVADVIAEVEQSVASGQDGGDHHHHHNSDDLSDSNGADTHGDEDCAKCCHAPSFFQISPSVTSLPLANKASYSSIPGLQMPSQRYFPALRPPII